MNINPRYYTLNEKGLLPNFEKMKIRLSFFLKIDIILVVVKVWEDCIMKEKKKELIALGGALAAFVAIILISMFALKIPVVAVCVILILNVGIACCLHHEPVWLHGLVLLAELVAGILCKKIIFILLCMVIYVIAILALRYRKEA